MPQATAPPPEETMFSIDEAEKKHRPGCVKGCILGQDEVSGNLILVPLCCKNWNCPACAVRLRDRWADVAVRGEPQRFVTVTGDPKLHPDPREMRIAIKNAWAKFVSHWRRGKVRKDGKHTIPPHELEYIQAWELHKSGYPHLHVLVRGEYIPQSYLKRWMETAGVGECVWINKVTNTRGSVVELLKYVTKAANSDTDVFTGSRIITTSRDYVPGALPKPDNNNTPGYEWIRLRREAADVYEALVKDLGYKVVEGSLPHRLEFQATEYTYDLNDLWMKLAPLTDFIH